MSSQNKSSRRHAVYETQRLEVYFAELASDVKVTEELENGNSHDENDSRKWLEHTPKVRSQFFVVHAKVPTIILCLDWTK